MYSLKTIYFDHQTNDVKVQNGIQIGLLCNSKAIARDAFGGKSDIHFGDYADFNQIPTINEFYKLLSYISEYEVENIDDGFKKFSFYVSTYQPEKNYGYIVFIQNSLKEIRTTGKKLFGRFPTEIVVVLKNRDFLEFKDRRFEVF